MTTAPTIPAPPTRSTRPRRSTPPTRSTRPTPEAIPGSSSASARWAVRLVAAYAATMPLLAGLPRGAWVPALRPSEVVQVTVTLAVAALMVPAIGRGQRWRWRPGPSEWWLVAVAATSSIGPLLLWLARGRDLTPNEIIAAVPLVKYAGLYLLFRVVVRSGDDVRLVVRAALGAAVVVAGIAVAQVLGVGPVVDLLGRFYVSSDTDLAAIAAGGRGTATLGSSIATGAFLTLAAGVALAWAHLDPGPADGTRLPGAAGHRWLALAGVLTIGAVASGQVGTLIALAVTGVVVAAEAGRLARFVRWGAAVGVVAAVGLWPVISARLATIDPSSGVPSSWLIRWTNVAELFWPSLANGGWALGVGPDATVVPPDVWRDVVYLESGYLWLLWVGGLPLLVSTIGLWWSAYRRAGRPGPTAAERAVATATRAAVATFAVISLFDPHLTLRGGADLFFILLALSATASPFVVDTAEGPTRWTARFGPAVPTRYAGARIQIGEAGGPPPTVELGGQGRPTETVLRFTVVDRGSPVAAADLALVAVGTKLHGVVVGAGDHSDPDAEALLWRGLVRSGASLGLASLHWPTRPTDSPDRPDRPGWANRADRAELVRASALATTRERTRARHGAPSTRSGRKAPGSDHQATVGTGIRLETVAPIPRWKRATDVVIASVALVATTPIWLGCAVAVRRSSPGPVLFRQVRVGAGGLPFRMTKFRTMYVDNDDRAHRAQNRREILEGAGATKDGDDPRITPIGRTLRRLSLDELPQLLNVLGGQMSLVGPRPSLVWEVELFESAARRRLTVRPGITGLWQVSGRAEVSMGEMLDLDLHYVDRFGPGLDARCLAATASAVVRREGAR